MHAHIIGHDHPIRRETPERKHFIGAATHIEAARDVLENLLIDEVTEGPVVAGQERGPRVVNSADLTEVADSLAEVRAEVELAHTVIKELLAAEAATQDDKADAVDSGPTTGRAERVSLLAGMDTALSELEWPDLDREGEDTTDATLAEALEACSDISDVLTRVLETEDDVLDTWV